MTWSREQRRAYDRIRNQRPDRKAAARERQRRLRQEHPENNHAACLRWRATHREQWNAYMRRYFALHPEKRQDTPPWVDNTSAEEVLEILRELGLEECISGY